MVVRLLVGGLRVRCGGCGWGAGLPAAGGDAACTPGDACLPGKSYCGGEDEASEDVAGDVVQEE